MFSPRILFLLPLLIPGIYLFTASSLSAEQKPPTDKSSTNDTCIEVLRSNCSVSQQTMLNQLLEKLDIHGISNKQYPGKPAAFDALPKDKTGQVNWVKAFNQGLIKPRSAIHKDDMNDPYKNFYKDLIFMQVKVHIMADVVFPHGMHSYWMNCDSCHPKPFKKENGSNNIKMDEILDGKWCGKCHGKVAFSPDDYTNCRRCHVIQKKIFRPALQ